jgi:hypothetical protein
MPISRIVLFLLLVATTLALLLTLVSSTRATADTRPSPQATPPLYLGIDSYRHWDKLSYLEIGDRIWGQATADPAGTNADNSHVMRVLTDGQHVLFDQTGPGVMTWMRNQQFYGGPWKLSLDGTLVATIGADDLGQVDPTTFPATAMPYPLSMNIGETQGSSILAVTIPFVTSMSWASVNPNGNFYSIYRKLPYGYPIATWTGSEPISDVVQLLRQAGTDIAPTGIYSQSGMSNIPAGETTLTNLSGHGQVRAIKFRVPFADQVRFGNSRLRIYWDGEPTPSVDAPVKFLAGDGAGVYQPVDRPLVRGWIAGAGTGGATYMDFNLYWPMPYASSARIAISSALPSPINNVAWSVRYEPFTDPPGWWGNFHALYTSIPNPTPGEDMTFLDVTGSGRVVGTIVNFTAPDGTLEGDPHFFIDDNNTPQVQITGTEEWGTGGNYWNGGNQTTLPVGGLPSSINNPPGTDVDGSALYRFLVSDSIPFNRHIVLRWEHGPANDVNDHPYRAAVLWYANPVQTARLTDDLWIADPISRTLHKYQSPAATYYTLTAAYEYPVHNPLSTDTGINTTGVTTFTMALDPANVGAFLRRKFDYAAPNQRARLFVDGQPAGTWYTGGYFDGADIDGHVRRWREEELPLSPALTAGKSSITIRVEFVPTTDPPNTYWTEFRYQLYSLVMPPDSDPPTATPNLSATTTPTPTATQTPTNTPAPSATSTSTTPPTPTSTPTSPAFATTPPSTPTTPPLATSTPSPTSCAITFSDVPVGSTFYPYVRCLACRGIINGYPDGTFRPHNNLTRGQLAKIVANAMSGLPPVAAHVFEDVPPGSTYYTPTGILYGVGILHGYPCNGPSEPCVPPQNRPYYRPNNPASRGQAAKVVEEAISIGSPPGPPSFQDVPGTHPFFTQIQRLADSNIVQGYPCGNPGEPCVPPQNLPYFRPNNIATRGQSVKMVSLGFYETCSTPNR